VWHIWKIFCKLRKRKNAHTHIQYTERCNILFTSMKKFAYSSYCEMFTSKCYLYIDSLSLRLKKFIKTNSRKNTHKTIEVYICIAQYEAIFLTTSHNVKSSQKKRFIFRVRETHNNKTWVVSHLTQAKKNEDVMQCRFLCLVKNTFKDIFSLSYLETVSIGDSDNEK
jgi:hypothetical protein